MRRKIRLSIVLLLISVVTALGVVIGFNMHSIRLNGQQMEETLQYEIEATTYEKVQNIIAENLIKTTNLNASLYDEEFSAFQKQIVLIADYITDMYSHPERYGAVEVPEPNKNMSTMELTTQILYSAYVDKKNPDLQREAGFLGNVSNILKNVTKNGSAVSTYVTSRMGFTITMDYFPNLKLNDKGEAIPFEGGLRPWYTGAAEGQGPYFSPIMPDYYDADRMVVMCGVPFYNNGEFAGVCGGDVYIDYISNNIKELSLGEGGYGCMIDDDGRVIVSNATGELSVKNPLRDDAYLQNSDNEDLAELVKKGIDGEEATSVLYIDGNMYYVAISPLKTIGWSLICVVPYQYAVGELYDLLDDLDKTTQEYSNNSDIILRNAILQIAVLGVILLIIGLFIARYLSNILVKPIQLLTSKVNDINGDNLDFTWDLKTGDETEVLGNSFENLTQKLKEYIKNLTDVTAEKERIGAELNIATKIQADMLPSTFPAFPDIPQVDIYAIMDPAKEVAGDFYDFFRIDRRHIGLVMADVSGKGVPASLFMVVSKTTIKNKMMIGAHQKPSEILETSNNILCQNNEEMMFCTAWIGILNIETGVIRCSSAGHEYPFVMDLEKGFHMFEDNHGVPLGAMENMTYEDYEIVLNPGEAIYLCTDGVTEATDANEELFGREKLVDALNIAPGAASSEILENVKLEIQKFVKEAPQFDDITMLCLRFFGSEAVKRNVITDEFELQATKENYTYLHDRVDDLLTKTGCPSEMKIDIEICVEEVFVNVASYAYEEGLVTGMFNIKLEIYDAPYLVKIEFKDTGKPYNPLKNEDPDINLTTDKRKVGGLGIYFVKKLMDSVEYKHEDGYNILTITKEAPWH